jgi:hypothetical protein
LAVVRVENAAIALFVSRLVLQLYILGVKRKVNVLILFLGAWDIVLGLEVLQEPLLRNAGLKRGLLAGFEEIIMFVGACLEGGH